MRFCSAECRQIGYAKRRLRWTERCREIRYPLKKAAVALNEMYYDYSASIFPKDKEIERIRQIADVLIEFADGMEQIK